LKNRFLVYILIVIAGCAIRENPDGGPVDKKPPEVIFTFPQSDSTGIQDINKIEIQFSERMNRSSVENSIFISPPIDFESDWSGWDEITLKLKEKLRADKTYVVTLAVSTEDINRNRLKQSYQFAFSKGDKIDRGQIPGRVLGLKNNESFYLYAYLCDHPDSLNPTITKADFLTMPDAQGNFELNYLSLGTYRVFAVEDINRNLLLDANIERIGIPWCDVTLDSFSLTAPQMTFKLTKVDTTPPVIIDVHAINNRSFMVRFSEPLAEVTNERVVIKDTLIGSRLAVKAFYQDPESPNQYVFLTSLHDSTSEYQIIFNSISDSTGNHQKKPQSAYFSGSSQVDTTKFQLLEISPQDSLSDIALTTPITLKFSLPVDTLTVLNSVVLFSSIGDTLSAFWTWEALKKGTLITGKHFLPGSVYHYQIFMGTILTVWGDSLADSSFTRTFFVISENEFGSISGKYLGDATQNVYIHDIPIQLKQAPVNTRVKQNGDFILEWLLDGKYKIGGYVDKNNDGIHSRGSLIPFHFAEPYHQMDDTIRVKKRWEKTDVNFRIPGVE
jgi:hypothetical protein